MSHRGYRLELEKVGLNEHLWVISKLKIEHSKVIRGTNQDNQGILGEDQEDFLDQCITCGDKELARDTMCSESRSLWNSSLYN